MRSVLEPLARNTALAIALAALQALSNKSGITLLALPADHLIGDAHSSDDQIAACRCAELFFVPVSITFGMLFRMIGLIGDLIATNRELLERIDVRLKHRKFGSSNWSQINDGDG